MRAALQAGDVASFISQFEGCEVPPPRLIPQQLMPHSQDPKSAERDLDSTGRTLLHAAAEHGGARCVEGECAPLAPHPPT